MPVIEDNKLEVTCGLVTVAKDLVKMKRDVMLVQMRRAVARSVHLKQVNKLEGNLVDVIAPVIEQQVKTIASGLAELDGPESKSVTLEKSHADTAHALVQHSFDAKGEKDKLVDEMLPVLAAQMAESAIAHFLQMGVVIRRKKSVSEKFNPHHGPDGRFSSGSGSGGGHYADTSQGVDTQTASAFAAATAKTGEAFEATCYRGTGLSGAEAARTRIPSQYAQGEYWSPFPEVASTYGPDVLSQKVTLQNPRVFRLPGKRPYFAELQREFGTKNPVEITQKLKSDGHDGLIVQNVPVNRRSPDGEGVSMGDSVEVILFNKTKSFEKFNPYHGPDGRFSSGSGSGAHMAPDTGGGAGGGSGGA